MKQTIIPRNDPSRVIWLSNFASKLGTYATKYNITTAEVTTITTMDTFFSYWVNTLAQLREYVSKVTGFKNEMADGVDAGVENPTAPTIPTFDTAPTTVTTGIFPYAMSIVKRIKNHKDYAVSDGQDMGIEGEEITEESVNDSKPSLKLVLVNGGHPEVQWVKKNMDAIAIYVSRNNSTWELLAIDTVPNYTDTFSLPASGQAAIWKYKAIYRLNDSNVGQWSDEVSVSVSGV